MAVLITSKCYKNDQRLIFFKNLKVQKVINVRYVKKMSLAIRYDGRP